MVILNPSDTTHSITIIPRENSVKVDVSVRQEKSDLTTDFLGVDTTYNAGYMTFSLTMDVAERDTLEIEVTNDGVVLWRGKAFCTAQTDLENFKINVITY